MVDKWLEEDIERAVATVRSGGILVYPTDTIWGVGCDAMNPEAVERIFDLKERPRSKPMVLIVSSIEMLKHYVDEIHPRVETLLTLHERPLTVIYPKAGKLPDYLKSEDDSIAIRVVLDPFCRELIEQCQVPLISTSANRSGSPFPSNFDEIEKEILAGADYVCLYRRNDRRDNAPSVIASYDRKGQLEFVRS